MQRTEPLRAGGRLQCAAQSAQHTAQVTVAHVERPDGPDRDPYPLWLIRHRVLCVLTSLLCTRACARGRSGHESGAVAAQGQGMS